MLNVPLLTAAGFVDECFNMGKHFMRRDYELVGNMTIHSKVFVSYYDNETVAAWQMVNVYITNGMQHLSEYSTPEDERYFKSTEEALQALGFTQSSAKETVGHTVAWTAQGEAVVENITVCPIFCLVDMNDGRSFTIDSNTLSQLDIRVSDTVQYTDSETLSVVLEKRQLDAKPFLTY